MKLARCTKNHYYDSDKYSSCPHCAASVAVNEIPSPDSLGSNPMNINGQNSSSPRLSEYFSMSTNKFHDEDPQNNTQPLVNKQYDLQPSPEPVSQPRSEPDPQPNPEPVPRPNPEPVPQPRPKSAPQPQTQLTQQISEAGYTGSMDDIHTMVKFTDIPDEPIVGWFAAIKGIEKGASFEVRYGRTTIGRSGIDYLVDVDLHMDASISRGAQAIVVYDPRNKKFIIQSTNGKTFVYVNGEMLMSHMDLKLYDIVSIGESDLIFVPLCSERFSWDQMQKD